MRMLRRRLLCILLPALSLLLCSADRLAASTVNLSELQANGAQWGVFIDPPANRAYYSKENVASPSLSGAALRTAIVVPPTGSLPADSYTGIHTYRNLPFADGQSFQLSLDFRYSSQQFPVQALEFTMNKWDGAQRFEWALQWENIGDGTPRQGNPPTWRLWDGAHWVAFNYDQQLAPDDWHSLVLFGDIQAGQVHYSQFTSDGTTFSLGQTYAPVADPASKLAVAVQLDGDAAMHTQDLFMDHVNFSYSLMPEPSSAALLGMALLVGCCWNLRGFCGKKFSLVPRR